MKAQDRAAQWLDKLYCDGQPMAPFPEPLAPATLADAYAIQDAFQLLLGGSRGSALAGWKIALTTPAMQAFVGIDHPCEGAIFHSQLQRAPAVVRAADFLNLGVETEIAVRLGRDLPAAGTAHDRDSVAGAVTSCMAATELVDDRNWDYERPDPMLLIAANSLNAGCVLGPEIENWRELDLCAAAGRMTINDSLVGEGLGRDVLGHPLDAVAWLANSLNRRGRQLHAGEIVLTGSIVTTKWLKPGDHMVSTIEGLGSAELQVE